MSRRAFLLVTVLCLAAPLHAETGSLVIIGGGERPDSLMREIVELAGGAEARMVVVPTASSDPEDVGDFQRRQLLDAGAGSVSVLDLSREQADSDAAVARLDGMTGVFFSGGDQRRLTAALLGTRVLDALRKIHENGGVLAGTSAGAAVMSPLMITGDEATDPEDDDPESGASFETIRAENVVVTPGFGFWPGVIVDQHFIRRKRQNRLLSLVLEHPDLLAVGIDESTAVVVQGSGFRVIGRAAVQVYDATGAKIHTDEDGGLAVFDLKTHLLRSGHHFDLETRRPAVER